MGIVLNPGSGGNTLNSDLVGGLDTQIVKVGVGAAGTSPLLVSSTNPMPVAGTVTVQGISTSVAVTGTVAISGTSAVSGAVTSAIQDGAGNALTSLALGAKRALTMALVDAAGNQITNFGGAGGTSQLDASGFVRGTNTETPVGGVVESANPTLAPGTAAALSLDTSGNLRVAVDAGGAQSGTAGTPSADVLSVQGVTGMLPLTVSIQPNDNPQTNRSRIKSGATTNATNLKASPGILLAYALFNNTASARYFKFYDKAASPSVGTDTPAFTVIVQANSGANVSFGDCGGMPFATGIAYAITGAIADTDTTNTAVDDVHGVLIWD